MSEDRSLDRSASNYLEAQNARRLAAMEDVKRIMKEEVRTDWVDLWEERWRRRLEKLQSRAASRGKSRAGSAEGGVKLEREGEGEESENSEGEDDGNDNNNDSDNDNDNDDDDGGDLGEWDGAGIGWDADQGDGEEVWVHRGDDSDFLKAADTYSSPGSLPRSPPPAQRNYVLRSPGRSGGGEGWTASVTRLMGGMGFGSSSSSPQLQPQSKSQSPQSIWSNAPSIYPSSSTPPPSTTEPTQAITSANLSVPGSPHLPLAAAASPYRFASPDSITPSLAALREKRREELKKQMDLSDPEGNVGLKCWVERRDAWTGANEEQCVRLGRSKFSENLLTASVNEAAYSAIYNKCIKKALPPVVPINLRHITKAMVAGWKKDNEWPPALAPPEPSFSKRRPARAPGRGGPGSSSPAMSGGGAGARRVLGML